MTLAGGGAFAVFALAARALGVDGKQLAGGWHWPALVFDCPFGTSVQEEVPGRLHRTHLRTNLAACAHEYLPPPRCGGQVMSVGQAPGGGCKPGAPPGRPGSGMLTLPRTHISGGSDMD